MPSTKSVVAGEFTIINTCWLPCRESSCQRSITNSVLLGTIGSYIVNSLDGLLCTVDIMELSTPHLARLELILKSSVIAGKSEMETGLKTLNLLIIYSKLKSFCQAKERANANANTNANLCSLF